MRLFADTTFAGTKLTELGINTFIVLLSTWRRKRSGRFGHDLWLAWNVKLLPIMSLLNTVLSIITVFLARFAIDLEYRLRAVKREYCLSVYSAYVPNSWHLRPTIYRLKYLNYLPQN